MQQEIGRFHTFKVLEIGAHSAILDAQAWGRLPLERKQCPESLAVGDQLQVFAYLEAEGRPALTTLQPAAQLGEVAWLEVVEINSLGAFVDWGLPKDLFIPFAEQQHPLKKGGHTLVKVYVDNQGRLAGSTRIDHWISDSAQGFKQGQRVSLMVAERTELGYKAIINHECWGLLYSNELYRRVKKGQVMEGFIQRIRDDGKIDLSVNQPGFSKAKMDDISTRILDRLRVNDGFLALTDKSPPQEIYAVFGVSKKVFKQAIGALYKQRVISLEQDGIRML
ncbi:S1-like domain-containing RNA-binding protein [Congregibacter variabilis]|uniref:S1-like domain-containing RNA-binding protein n=1 Tax=Congregibacter variabilis TaxID=3081200 RepID=A0ABZ0I6Q8_9GAMM|nr:S1-like domain-containing RNA-binding protein [Congregibacter sp. IMCC43200]